MAIDFCPGSKKFRQPEPKIVKCSSCGEEVEIWTDEFQRRCPKCQGIILRQEEGASCLDWCRYAKECVGGQTYQKYMQNKALTLKQKLVEEMEKFFADDAKRIKHAKNVMHFAEEISKQEKADWHIVIPASILHDIGIKEAEKKYGSNAGIYQEKEGPAIAKKILLVLSFKKEDVEEICGIIAHHHSPGKVETMNFKVLYDADWLVNLKDEVDAKDKGKLEKVINKVFLTETGKKIAEKLYL